MKRILCILAAGLFLFCCGCQNAKLSQEEQAFPAAFSASLHITHRDVEFDAACTRAADGTVTLEIQNPEAVRTLTFIQTKESCTVRFLGIELKTPEVLLPDTAFLKLLCAALDSAQNGTRCAVSVQGDSRIYSGMTETGDTFQLEQEKQNAALRILTMEGQKLTVIFSEFLIAETQG